MGDAETFAGEIGVCGLLDVFRGHALQVGQLGVHEFPGQADGFQGADGRCLAGDGITLVYQAGDDLGTDALQFFGGRWLGLQLFQQAPQAGFGTRLMSEVREKRGLTYGVYSGFSPMQARGPFMINLQTRAEMSGGTLRLVEDVLADYLKTGPTQKELDDAKRELAGSFPLSTASNADIVGQLGAMGFYNLPLSYLEDFMKQSQALTVEQVKAALNKHLSADKMVIVTAGPTTAQKPLPPPTDKPAEQPLGVPEH